MAPAASFPSWLRDDRAGGDLEASFSLPESSPRRRTGAPPTLLGPRNPHMPIDACLLCPGHLKRGLLAEIHLEVWRRGAAVADPDLQPAAV